MARGMLMLRILMALFESNVKTIINLLALDCFLSGSIFVVVVVFFQWNANAFQLPLFIAVVIFSAAIIDVYLESDWALERVERLMKRKNKSQNCALNHNDLLYQHLNSAIWILHRLASFISCAHFTQRDTDRP